MAYVRYRTEEGEARLGDLRILVVDDHVDFRRIVAQWLAVLTGVTRVDGAGSGAEALNLAERAAPDLVVTDLNMPAMDGLELTRRMKSRRNPPVVVIMTSMKDAKLDRQAQAVHADCAFDKYNLQEDLPAFMRKRFGVGKARRKAA